MKSLRHITIEVKLKGSYYTSEVRFIESFLILNEKISLYYCYSGVIAKYNARIYHPSTRN